nr:hypothetical protein [Kofleriaceae bacterium]
MNRLGWIVLALAPIYACDSRAKGADPRGDSLSKEYESCSASSDCEDKLRCFEHACRRVARNTVGDYYAAVGQVSLAKGDVSGAVAAYEQALGHYEQAAPPDVDCAYGAALAAGRAKHDNAELGARVLHRCLNAVAGGELRERALRALALLSDSGLDPLLLQTDKLADVYLKLAPAAPPPPSDHAVTVAASPAVTAAGFQAFPDKIASAELHAGMNACWDAYHKAANKDAMVVTLPLRAAYVPSQYDDEQGSFAFAIDATPGLAGADAAADECVRALVGPELKKLPLQAGFATKLAITVK